MPSEKVKDILYYLPISDTIGTAGQPTEDQFADIRAAGYEVVINLAMPDSSNALPHESELVAEQGITYVHIPVVWESPTLKDLEQFFAAMERLQHKRVLVHCAVNKRVSVFVFLYRVIRQGVLPEMALETLQKIWEPNDVWQDFMSRSLAHYGISISISP